MAAQNGVETMPRDATQLCIHSLEEIVTREHDELVFRAIIAEPTTSAIVASIRAITDMLRRERELVFGGDGHGRRHST